MAVTGVSGCGRSPAGVAFLEETCLLSATFVPFDASFVTLLELRQCDVDDSDGPFLRAFLLGAGVSLGSGGKRKQRKREAFLFIWLSLALRNQGRASLSSHGCYCVLSPALTCRATTREFWSVQNALQHKVST